MPDVSQAVRSGIRMVQLAVWDPAHVTTGSQVGPGGVVTAYYFAFGFYLFRRLPNVCGKMELKFHFILVQPYF